MRLRVKPRLRRLKLLSRARGLRGAGILALSGVAVVAVVSHGASGTPVAYGAPGFFPRAARAVGEPAPDPDLPPGPLLPVRNERPDSSVGLTSCSTARPVCVQGVQGFGGIQDLTQDQVNGARVALEDAYRDLVDVLGLPAPLLDAGAETSANLDLYLIGGSRAALRVERDAVADRILDSFDSATAYCVVGNESVTVPADLARAATLCVGEAIAWRLAPSETPFVRRAYAAHLWHLVGAPGARDFEVIDELQSNPQRAVVDSELNSAAEASSLFLDYLSYRVESSSGYRLPTALLSLSASSTDAGAWRWNNEPDVFDVLRASFEEVGVPKLLLDFAVARAFLGDRDDGTQMPPLRWSGSFGRVRFDWHVPWTSLPRHVACVHPIEPTGSVYLWLDLDDLPDDERETARLGFQATWEAPGSFAWSLVKVDAKGSMMGRIDLPYLERGSEIETSLATLRGAAAVIVVGTNLGGLNEHPFDPDAAPFEPRGCTVYLTAL